MLTSDCRRAASFEVELLVLAGLRGLARDEPAFTISRSFAGLSSCVTALLISRPR
jgi:hypothetical protein